MRTVTGALFKERIMKESEVYEILNSLNMFESYQFDDDITYKKVPFGYLVTYYDSGLKKTFVYDGRDK